MGVKKTTKKKSTLRKAIDTGKKALKGNKKEGGTKRRRGPTYYANKVLVEKLKRKLYKLKYGGR